MKDKLKPKYPYYPYDVVKRGKLWYMIGHTHGKYWMQLGQGRKTRAEVIQDMKHQKMADKSARRLVSEV